MLIFPSNFASLLSSEMPLVVFSNLDLLETVGPSLKCLIGHCCVICPSRLFMNVISSSNSYFSFIWTRLGWTGRRLRLAVIRQAVSVDSS